MTDDAHGSVLPASGQTLSDELAQLSRNIRPGIREDVDNIARQIQRLVERAYIDGWIAHKAFARREEDDGATGMQDKRVPRTPSN